MSASFTPVRGKPASSEPPDRATGDDLQRDVRVVCSSPVMSALLEAVDGGVLVLNTNRQILAANLGRLWQGDGAPEPAKILGLRPGEAFHCIHESESPDRCGAAAACQDCGGLGAILACMRTGTPQEKEYLLTFNEGSSTGSLELKVRATPVTLEGRPYIVVTLRDISGEKRREALEQVFLHDLLNSVAAISGWSWALGKASQNDYPGAAERISRLIDQLGREITYQRALLEAERGTLQPNRIPVEPGFMLAEIKAACAHQAEARGRTLAIENVHAEGEVFTDPVLLQRVLINMVKNALEATSLGGTVRLWCEPTTVDGQAGVAFRVHNAQSMHERVARRVFQRSFSTKPGKGRGLGTYSMKLLGERYLGGQVSFVTGPETGTTFSLSLPWGYRAKSSGAPQSS